MELVEGPTLADRIRQGPLSLDEASRIARQIADTLDYAHERGIVHRDLKPGNVKIRPDGVVKVLDFGLAKAGGTLASAHSDDSPTITTPRTEAGVIVGTAAYMAPEQIKGSDVDKRADIWAVGCVFYEMLTGRSVYHGDTSQETFASILRDEPDLSKVSVRARRLLKQCLEKDPQKRLRHIGDVMLLAITSLAKGETGHRWPQFLPDGRHFVYLRVSSDSTQMGVYVGSIDAQPGAQSLERVLATNREAYYAAAPGGGPGYVVFLRGATLMAQPFDPVRLALGGEPVPVAEGVDSNALATYALFSVSDTGTLVYRLGVGSNLVPTWFDAQGTPAGTLGEPGEFANPAVSPDGTRVAGSHGGGYRYHQRTSSRDSAAAVHGTATDASCPVESLAGRQAVPVHHDTGWRPDGAVHGRRQLAISARGARKAMNIGPVVPP